MADVKISALPAATTPLAGTEVLPIVQSATTDQVSVANLTAGRAVSAASLTLTTTPLAVGSGGTGLTSLTTGYIPYGNGTSAFNNSANLTYSGTVLTAVGEIYASQAATNTQQIRLTPQSSGSNIIYSTYAGTNSYLPLVFNVGGSDRLTIATSGNVGIGTASPSGILHTYATNGVNWFESPGISSVSLQFKTNSSNRFRIGIPSASADLAFWSDAGSTEVMRIDSNGRVRINTTAAITSSAEYLSVNGMGTFSQNSSTAAAITVQNTNATASTYIPFISLNDGGGNRAQLGTYSDTAGFYLNGQFGINFNTGGTKRAFLDASGNLLIGTTTANGLLTVAGKIGSTDAIEIRGNNSVSAATGNGQANIGSSNTLGLALLGQGSTYDIIFLNKAGSVAGYVATGATTITTSSDERMKENFTLITQAISKVNELRAVIGNFKEDFDPTKARQPFLIAQDLDKVLPEAVVKANPDQWGINYTQVVPLLTAAIQELAAKVAELEAKI